MTTIGDRIKKRRHELGISADEVAKKIRKDRATVFRYENNEILNVPSTILEQLATILDTSPAYLMGWKDDETIFLNRQVNEMIKERRIKLGLTMLDIAKAVGVSEATVSRWESGEISNMRRDRIAGLARVLEISPGIITGWEDNVVSAPSPKMSLSDEEQEHMKKYRAIPEQAKRRIDNALDFEYHSAAEK